VGGWGVTSEIGRSGPAPADDVVLALHAYAHALGEAADAAAVASHAVQTALSLLGASGGGVAALRSDGTLQWIVVTQAAQALVRTDLDDAALSALRDMKHVAFTFGRGRDADPGAPPGGSCLAVPLVDRDEPLAAMALVFPDDRAMAAADQALAPLIAELAARAMARLRVEADLVAARGRVEDVRKRAAILSDASTTLVKSLDFGTTVQTAARLAVPALGEWCFVDLADGQTVRRHAMAFADQSNEARARELLRQDPRGQGTADVLEPALVDRPLLVDVVAASESGRASPELRRLADGGVASYVKVPLSARSEAIGTMMFVSTVPDRRHSAVDLEIADELAGRVALALEAARLFDEARRAVRARDDFLTAIAHDLTNPLTALKLRTEVLARRLRAEPGTPRSTIVSGLDQVIGCAVVMGRLIEDLLDTARLQSGRLLDLHLERVDLVGLVREATAELQPLAERHRIRLETEQRSLRGNWDAARVRRVVDNLVTNAVKYSPAGGDIVIRVRRERRDGRNWAVLSVEDHGIGIPAGDLPFVFDQFVRASNAPRRVLGGGIGLSSVRQIVEQHGGDVSVQSQVGVGSTFVVRLPLERPTASTPRGGVAR